MTVLLVPMAADSSTSFSVQPFIVFVFIALALLSAFFRAANRKKRAQQANPNAQAPQLQRPQANQAGRNGTAQQQRSTAKLAPGAQYSGTLLNGVPMKSYDNPFGYQATGFANERMRMEAELKRQLDALDAARRAGQVTAEQYAAHREAIFKTF